MDELYARAKTHNTGERGQARSQKMHTADAVASIAGANM